MSAHNIDSTYDIDNIIRIDNGRIVDVFERTRIHKDLNNIINYGDNIYYDDNLRRLE